MGKDDWSLPDSFLSELGHWWVFALMKYVHSLKQNHFSRSSLCYSRQQGSVVLWRGREEIDRVYRVEKKEKETEVGEKRSEQECLLEEEYMRYREVVVRKTVWPFVSNGNHHHSRQ